MTDFNGDIPKQLEADIKADGLTAARIPEIPANLTVAQLGERLDAGIKAANEYVAGVFSSERFQHPETGLIARMDRMEQGSFKTALSDYPELQAHAQQNGLVA